MSDFRIKQSISPMKPIERFLEAVTIATTLYLSQWLAGQSFSEGSTAAVGAAVAIYFIISELTYSTSQSSSRTLGIDLLRILCQWLLTVGCLSLLAFFTKQTELFSRSSVLGWILLTGASLGLVHILLQLVIELLFSTGWSRRRCAIAGLNHLGVQLFRNSVKNPEYGLDVVGFYDDRHQSRRHLDPDSLNLFSGKLDELVHQARLGKIDTVFVTLPMRAEERIRWLLDQLADTTASVYIVPDFFVFELLHSRWNSIGGLPAVSVFETPLYGVDGALKRGFDILSAAIGILLLLPVFLICGICVKSTSSGPVFFRQVRYGLDGKKIWVWKFRTMTTQDNGLEVQQAMKGDQRITRVGAFLRRTSLDELPQLFNVIEGTMSLVGPRPHASAHNEHYRKLIRGYMLRHKVKPGITGLAQVNGFRGETETVEKMKKRVEFDHKYIQQWSLWLDIQIIFRTLKVVYSQENAY
jgi:putative colanic acid biosynthesis UDP-glucose lipid carrier transferase